MQLQYLSTRMNQSSTALHVSSGFFTSRLGGTSPPSLILVFHAAILSTIPRRVTNVRWCLAGGSPGKESTERGTPPVWSPALLQKELNLA